MMVSVVRKPIGRLLVSRREAANAHPALI